MLLSSLLAVEPDPAAGGAGPLGLLVIAILAVVTVLLIRNMRNRLRNLPPSFDQHADDDETPPPSPRTP